MSSLLAIVRKRHFYVPESACTSETMKHSTQIILRAIRAAHSGVHKYVNAQSVFDDMRSPDQAWTPEMLDYFNVPIRLTPPYPDMWIEARFRDQKGSQNVTFLLRRFDFDDRGWAGHMAQEIVDAVLEDKPTWVIHCLVFVEYGGSAMFAEEQLMWLDANGRFQRSARIGILDKDNTCSTANTLVARCHTAFLVHTLARFNCANASIRPLSNGRKSSRRRNQEPSTVWNTIVVSQVRAPRATKQSDGDGCTQLRSHWVRGHYADYSSGAGLFGRESLRGVFWIHEHQRGEVENGKVISDYRVAARVQGATI